MTETIETLKELNENYFQTDKEGEFDDVNKALDIAIQALEEVEQYRALGTVEELKEAREKQIAKKPKKVKGQCYAKAKDGEELYEVLLICPNCKSQVLVNPLPCKCGQMIDWKDISKLDWSKEDENGRYD